MKKNLLAPFISAALLMPMVALAIPGTIGNFGTFADRIKDFAWQIFGLVAVVMFVIAGILFLTAQGDTDKLTKAKQAFLWGVAGVVVGIIAYSILAIAGALLGTGI